MHSSLRREKVPLDLPRPLRSIRASAGCVAFARPEMSRPCSDGVEPAVPTRHRARLIAFQILYSLDYNPVEVDEALQRYSHIELDRKRPLPQFSISLLNHVREHLAEIDDRIAEVLERWRPERLGATDRALLRLGCAELLYIHDIPIKVTLDEYIELAREFGDDSSAAFVNGILDAIHKKNPPDLSSPPSDQPAT